MSQIAMKTRYVCVAVSFLAVSIFCLPASPSHASVLVDCTWLREHAHAPDLRIVDVSKKAGTYDKGHIPGAVKVSRHIDLEDYTAYPPVGYPQQAQFQKLMGRLAITPETTVVAYDDNRGVYAARLFFLMRLYGHSVDRLKILNGGINAWRDAGLPVSNKAPAVQASTPYPAERTYNDFLASWQEVYREVVQAQHPDTVLLDVRREVEYTGEAVRLVRGGHIPGAVNLDLAALVSVDEAGRWKSPDALRTLFEKRHITPERPVIIYCHSGDRSAHAFVIMKYVLGFHDVKIYEKAWEEWAVRQALPVVSGD